MKELAELESRLLEQDFIPQQKNCVLEQYKQTAAMYAQTRKFNSCFERPERQKKLYIQWSAWRSTRFIPQERRQRN